MLEKYLKAISAIYSYLMKRKTRKKEHHGIRYRIKKYQQLRKEKEEHLPRWKEAFNRFNEHYMGWLERFVDGLIPWLVLLLLFIILGEFSHSLNVFHWGWLDAVAEFFEHNEPAVRAVDHVIIAFFVIDLYFNFFKKRTVWRFFKTSILDIIAVAPLGLILRIAEISEAQSILHVTTEIEKEASKIIRGEEAAARLLGAERFAELSRLSAGARIARVVSRIPRFFRLNHLFDFFARKK